MSSKKQQAEIGETITESTPCWPDPARPRPGAPNIVFVVLDDTGYADLGCFGSEIATPNIDRLAGNGLRYSNFHTTPLCSPTRAALLTGRNHHNVGMRFLSEVSTGFPNCRGRISDETATLAQMLLATGYSTMAVGKWHLSPASESTPAGPFHNWPLGKGFERYYGFLGGVTDQYLPELVEDNRCIGPPERAGYHLTEDLIDKSIRFVSDLVSTSPERPFFLYLGLGATHAPHQVHERYVARYDTIFKKGWDKIREDRLNRQKELGIVPPDTQLTERNQDVPTWDSLNEDEKKLFARLQAAYAGFLEHTDDHLGRLFDFLQRIDRLENTIVVLLSDNGAADQGGRNGAFNVLNAYNHVAEDLDENLRRLSEIGGPTSATIYPTGWAMAGNTPFRRYKQFVDGGGVNTPLIIAWPAGLKERGAIRRQFVHAIDITPTILDLVAVAPVSTLQGVAQKPLDGSTIAPTFNDPSKAVRHTQYFEMLGRRGIWHRGWKALTQHESGSDFSADQWQLYCVDEDFSECNNLVHTHPGKLEDMIRKWWEEAAKYDVLPLDDRTLSDLVFALPHGFSQKSEFVYYPSQSYLPINAAPRIGDRSFAIRAELYRHAHSDQGVILAVGTRLSGYTLYLKDRHCVFEYNSAGNRTVFMSRGEVSLGAVALEFRFRRTGRNTGTGKLLINDEETATGTIPRLLHQLSFVGLQVGRNRFSAVSPSYADMGEFAFTEGALKRVLFSVGDDGEPDPNLAYVAQAQQ